MSRFWELLPSFIAAKNSAAAQDESDKRFPSAVESSRLLVWRPGDLLPTQGTHILIGVATWSGYDLELLEVLDDALICPSCDNPIPVVHVFNIAGLSLADLEQVIPGLPSFGQTPFVGIWRDGVLREKAAGHDGRRLVARELGFDSDEIISAVRRRTSRTAPASSGS
jgi:hypothetical protein